MTAWLLHKTVETIEYLPADVLKMLSDKIGFQMIEIDKWNDIVRKLNVVITEDNIISQFDGYMDLLELDWDHYREKYGDIHRLDRILKSEGDSPDKYKVTKQADVLMTYYVLSPGQVKHNLKMMRCEVVDELDLMARNYNYYAKRTSHGSTLSMVVHSAILKYLHSNKKDMWDWFLSALESDIYDTQGGTTAEAIHCGVMGGTLDIIFKSFAGINIFKDYIQIEPNLPAQWLNLSFKVLLRNVWIGIEISQETIKVQYLKGIGEKANIQVGNTTYVLKNHAVLEVPYHTS